MSERMEELKCEDCGTTDAVSETFCPYQHDVNDTYVEVNLCPECYHERRMNI